MGFGGQPEEGAARIRALAQTVADLVRPDGLDGLRAIDLGAGGGELAADLALRGADVVAVEGREENARAIEALRDRHGIAAGRLRVEVADVRDLDWSALGRFDVVVCSGLLYHLELDDQVALTRAMRAACDRLAFVDTEVAWGPVERRGGYAGHSFREHDPGAGAAERAAARLASLDNTESFWLTRASLHALLHDAGFSSSWELGAPGQPRRERRATVAAIAGASSAPLPADSQATTSASGARPTEPAAGRVDRARIALARLRERAPGRR
jgi:SAM-dependent methyltransferase